MLKPAKDVAITSAKNSRTCLQETKTQLQNSSQTFSPFSPLVPSKKPKKPNPNQTTSQEHIIPLWVIPEGRAWLSTIGQGQRQMKLVRFHLVAIGLRSGERDVKNAGVLGLPPLPVLMVSVWLAFIRCIFHPLVHPFSEREKISLVHMRSYESLLLMFLEHLKSLINKPCANAIPYS